MIVAVALIAAWVGMTVVCLIGFALVTLWRGARWCWDSLMWKRDIRRAERVLDRFERKAQHMGAMARTLDEVKSLPEADVFTLAERWL